MSRSQFIVRVWIWKICARDSRSGSPNSTCAHAAQKHPQNMHAPGACVPARTEHAGGSTGPRQPGLRHWQTPLHNVQGQAVDRQYPRRSLCDALCKRMKCSEPRRTLRSRRPGRSSAGSSVSGLFVAISTCAHMPLHALKGFPSCHQARMYGLIGRRLDASPATA
jgi:hypothetical protein